MHPYSYNRLRLDSKSQATPGSEAPGAAENRNDPAAGTSPDIAQLMAMMEAMRGGKAGDAKDGVPPDLLRLLPLMQAMRGGASGGMSMQNLLPLLSMLGGKGVPPNLLSALESGGGNNANETMLRLLQGMMPSQTAQLMNMLASFGKTA